MKKSESLLVWRVLFALTQQSTVRLLLIFGIVVSIAAALGLGSPVGQFVMSL